MRTTTIAIRLLGAAALAGALTASVVHSSPEPVRAVPSASIPGPGAASSVAQRTKGPQPTTSCQQIAFNIGLHQPGVSQVVVVLTSSTTTSSGTAQFAQRGANGWTCGPAMSARVGKNGVRPLVQRRSGDGTTPAGVFPLATMTAWDGQQFSFFGNSADPGVSAGAYRRVRSGDCFGATPNHPDYGHLVYRTSNCSTPDEYLPNITGAYQHAALIGANMEPNVSGDAPGETPYASAIFLHRHSYDGNGNSKATSGCVSLSLSNLTATLTAMRPGAVFAIGETNWLLANT
jgi:L,D-peptidoglycan transpeptidase YkuD (ErfK/YbiS/YcfS/YnhG family)